MRPSLLARLGVLAGWLWLPLCAVATQDGIPAVTRLRSELGLSCAADAASEWRQRLRLARGAWTLQGDLRRGGGELGLVPHGSAWAAWNSASGWRISLGDHQVASDLQATLGRGRGGLPARPQGGVRSGAGGLSRQTPAERGLAVERRLGPLQGGILLADTRRDARADGQGFVLDLEHREAVRRRLGAWRDRLAVGWLDLEAPAAWDLHGQLGARRAPLGGGALGGIQAIRRRPTSQMALSWECGESRVAQLQAVRLKGRNWLQADLWQGRRLSSRFSSSALPLGEQAWGGGFCLQARHASRELESSAALRWLEPAARGTRRSALWWSLALDRLPLPAPCGLIAGVRHAAAEDRPPATGREEWRATLRPADQRLLDWDLEWQQAREAAGVLRWTRADLGRSWRSRRWSQGVRLQLILSSGSGTSRLAAVSLGPGLLRYQAMSGTRQVWGAGWWVRRGANQLSLGMWVRESRNAGGGLGREVQGQLRWVHASGG